MNRDLVNFMNTENNLKRGNSFNSNEINLKNVAIYNIRKNENGLYFNIKISGDYEKNISDLFIPVKYYQNENSYIKRHGLIVINKSKLVEYCLIYPAAVAIWINDIKLLSLIWFFNRAFSKNISKHIIKDIIIIS